MDKFNQFLKIEWNHLKNKTFSIMEIRGVYCNIIAHHGSECRRAVDQILRGVSVPQAFQRTLVPITGGAGRPSPFISFIFSHLLGVRSPSSIVVDGLGAC